MRPSPAALYIMAGARTKGAFGVAPGVGAVGGFGARLRPRGVEGNMG